MYNAYEHATFYKFYRHNGFLFRENQLNILAFSVRELLVCESHNGGLIRHFGVHNTLDILFEYFH